MKNKKRDVLLLLMKIMTYVKIFRVIMEKLAKKEFEIKSYIIIKIGFQNLMERVKMIVLHYLNPILNQYDYPELSVRVGIDVGDNVVVQYGWDTITLESDKVIRKPHLDILGYTISVTAKMTSLAAPNQIVVGEFVHGALTDEQKSLFKPLVVSTEVWEYMSDYTGKVYQLYGSVSAQ